jgi:adhesin transport system outer membrane protein
MRQGFPFARTLAALDLLPASTAVLAGEPPAPLHAAAPNFPAPAASSLRGSGSAVQRVPLDDLTLSNAIGIAIARHPDISRAHAEVAQRAAEVEVAKAAWYPKVDYGVKPGYGRSYSAAEPGNAGAVRTSLGVSQLVYDFGVTSNRIKAADASREQTRYQVADTVETVALNTATSFVELAAAQDRIAAARKQVEALHATRAKIIDRVRAGLSVSSDRTLADLAIRRAEAEVEQARTKRNVAAAKLAELIGVHPERVASLGDTVRLVGNLGEPGNDIDQRPSIKAADAAVHAADAKLEVARGSRYPSVGVGATRTVSTGPASALNDTWIGVAVNGSFNFGDLATHQIDAAQAAAQASREALENERLVSRSALRSAQTEADGAAERMASYEKIIELAQVSRDLYWQEYILNKRSLTDVLNPERDIYQSEVEWINALADNTMARIRTRVAVGRFVQQLRDREGNLHG